MSTAERCSTPPSDCNETVEVLKSGFLHKRGHFRKNWKKRYFHVTKNHIRYYEDESKKKELGSAPLINGELFEGPAEMQKKFPGAFVLRVAPTLDKTNSHQIYELAGESEEDSKAWIETLTSLIGAPIKRQGHLIKQGKTIKKWRQRFFRLRGGAMVYYLKEDSKTPHRVVPLIQAVATAVEPMQKYENALCVTVPSGRKYYMSAADEEDRAKWIEAINHEAEYVNREVRTQVRRFTQFSRSGTPKVGSRKASSNSQRQVQFANDDDDDDAASVASNASVSSDGGEGVDSAAVMESMNLREDVETTDGEKAAFAFTGGMLDKFTKANGFGKAHERYIRMLADASIVWDDRRYLLEHVHDTVSDEFVAKHKLSTEDADCCFWIEVNDMEKEVARGVWFKADAADVKTKWVAAMRIILVNAIDSDDLITDTEPTTVAGKDDDDATVAEDDEAEAVPEEAEGTDSSIVEQIADATVNETRERVDKLVNKYNLNKT